VERFRDPVVARAGRDTYRTTVPIRALFGVNDAAVHQSLVAPETATADDYTLEKVDATHFIIDERPDLVPSRLIALAEEPRR
jgi:surfactin synthase thioesterase subunit